LIYYGLCRLELRQEVGFEVETVTSWYYVSF
jgi:hypothetical protein